MATDLGPVRATRNKKKKKKPKKDRFVILLIVGNLGDLVPTMPTFSPQNLPNMIEYNATQNTCLYVDHVLNSANSDKL